MTIIIRTTGGIPLSLLSLHPLCGGGDLLFLLSPPAAAAAFCFCSHSKLPLGLFPNICIMHIGPGDFAWYFFFAFFSFFNNIQDGCQNPMSLSRAWTALWICYGSVFGVILIIKTVIVLRFRTFADISVLLAPAVTVGETKGAMDSTSVFFGLFFCL